MKHYRNIAAIVTLILNIGYGWAQHQDRAVSLPQIGSRQNSEYMQSDIPMFEYTDNGLRNKVCYNMLEDVDGYLWVVGSDGVSRFDGLSFINLLTSNSRDGMYNMAQAICEDTITNSIWISMRKRNAIVRIDKRTYKAQEVSYTIGNDAKDVNYLTLFNYNDSLLLGKTRLGINLINKYTGETTTPIMTESSNRNIQDQVVHMNNNDYIACSGGVYRIIGRDTPNPNLEKVEFGINRSIRHIAALNEKSMMIEVLQREQVYDLYSFDMESQQLKFIMRSLKPIKSITTMEDGFWLWTIAGVYFYRYADNQLMLYTTRNSSLKDNEFHYSIKLRNQPIIYVGTANGLLKNDYFNSKFKVTDIRRVSESANCNPLMTYKDKTGTYWLWLLDGMYRRKKNEYLFKRIHINDITSIGTLGCDEDTTRGFLYFNCVKRLVRYDMATERTITISPDIHNNRILTISIQPDGRLLYGTSNAAYEYNPKNGSNRCIIEFPNHLDHISALQFDGDTLLWLGNNKSQLFSCNIPKKEFRDEVTIGNEEKIVTHIRCVHGSQGNEVWIAASTNGLNYYLPEKHHVTRVEYHPMLFGLVSNLEIDKQNNVWVSSPDGLLCINNDDGNVYEYRRDIYNLGIRFNPTATSLSSDGNMLMGGPNFYIEFNSDNFAHNTYFPTPVVSSYKFVNSTAFDYDNYIEAEYYNVSDTIEVPAGIRSAQIQARMLNYSNPQYNLIQWRMPNQNSSWTTVNTESPITFPTLQRGISKLELRSCDTNGTPIDGTIRTLYFNKHVYFYEHPMFFALMIMLMLLLIVAMIVIRSHRERWRRHILELEVERQAGDIKRNNRQLRASQTMIERQNLELLEHRNNLEQQVAERTAELEVAKQKAEESSKLKSAFLANLSHEVRTPMNCIVGFSKLMADPDCNPADLREFAHLIQESSNSMLVLIGDLLDVSRIESGQMRVNLNNFEVSQEINDVFRLLSVERKNPTVDFILDADSSIRTRIIHSDKDRFRQIIINLCYNAFKFTEKGHVCIHANVIQPYQLTEYSYPTGAPIPNDVFELLLIRVEDTGIGIPADKTEVIFEPFRKLNNNKTLYPGLGLGLNIVKNLIRLLNGQIWLTSVEQQGTTFYFYLPF